MSDETEISPPNDNDSDMTKFRKRRSRSSQKTSRSTSSVSSPSSKKKTSENSHRFARISVYQGPTKHRHCTDLICTFVFFGVIAGWIAMISYGIIIII